MDFEDDYFKARKEDRLRDEEDEYNLRMHHEMLDQEEEKKKGKEERTRKQEEDYNEWLLESHGLNEGKEAEKERMCKEEEAHNEWLRKSHLRDKEEKKRAEGKEAEKERLCREEEAHNELLRESHLRDKEEKQRVEKDISSRPPSICNSCIKEPARFKLTIVQYRSGCTCKDPVSHLGKVTNLCSFECSYWDVDERYTEGGVSFVVMGGENECNVCGEPMMSTAKYTLEELNAGSTVTSSSVGCINDVHQEPSVQDIEVLESMRNE
jgi:hypothetical protein